MDPTPKASAFRASLETPPSQFRVFFGVLWALVIVDCILAVNTPGFGLGALFLKVGVAGVLTYNLSERRNWARITVMVLQGLSLGRLLFLFARINWAEVALAEPMAKFAMASSFFDLFALSWSLYYLSRADVRAYFKPNA